MVPGCSTCPIQVLSCWWGAPQPWSCWPQEQVWHVWNGKDSQLGCCPELGCGGQAQGCTAHTACMPHEAFSHFLTLLFITCFSSPLFSQINNTTLVTFPLIGPFPQGQMGFTGSKSLETVYSYRLRYKAPPFFDAWSQTLLNSGFVKASRKWLLYFFSSSLKKPLLDYIPVASVGQIFHNIVYSSFLGLLHAVNACVISGSSRWNTEERKRLKLLEEHSAALLLSHACGTSKNNS